MLRVFSTRRCGGIEWHYLSAGEEVNTVRIQLNSEKWCLLCCVLRHDIRRGSKANMLIPIPTVTFFLATVPGLPGPDLVIFLKGLKTA